MRDYGKLSPFFWTRGSGKRLRGNPDAQVVAAYLSTAPGANMIGIYYVSLASISSDTGIPDKRARAALKAIELAGYAFYDFVDEMVWVPNHAHFEIGPELRPGDKRRPRVSAELRQVDGHRFADAFRERYGAGWVLEPPIAPTEEGPSKGHAILGTDTEGASASHRGARAGQDQDRTITGQVSIGTASQPPPEEVTEVRPRRKPETPCPTSEATPIEVASWAAGWKIPPSHPEFARFLDHHRKGDARWRDWAAAWRTWLGNAQRFARGGPVPRQPIGSAASAPWMNPTENFDFGAGK